MLPEFGNNFCAACKPFVRIWHKRIGRIKGCPIIVIDADLQGIHAISSVFGGYLSAPLTLSAE